MTTSPRFKLSRILSYIGGIVCFFMAFWLYQSYSFIGFADGYKSELDRAREYLYPIYVVIYTLLGLSFFYFGWHVKKHHQKIKWAGLITLLTVILFFIVSIYLYDHLDHGQGG
ncbi:MAG: hypothetical protein AAFX87_14885 [Bacteroidota bacterium]